MSFIWPIMLLLLFTVPLAVWLYFRQQKRRQAMLARFNAFGFGQGNDKARLNVRRHIPPLLFLLALCLLIIAVARPETAVSLPRVEGTVVLAFDVSGSMAADDLKPTRMEAAKVAARTFVERQPPTVLIGVVAFSDAGLSVQIPTDDRDLVLAAINRLSPQRGTSLASGIQAALTTIAIGNKPAPRYYTNLTPQPTPSPTPVPKGTYTSGAIVLLTDGENNMTPDPLAAAQAAIKRGVRIYTVGIGSANGTNLKVEGFTVHTQLDEETLKGIAEITDGAYFNAEDEESLQKIYGNLIPEFVFKPEKMEVTSLFAGFSILILLIGGTISLMWFGRVP